MRAFVYCRVSTKEQSSQDHYSLDNQQQRCSDYIKGRQWRQTAVRKDIASGKNDEREGFQELQRLIAQKKIDVVVVYRLDRLSRNVRDIYDFLDSLQSTGIAFVSITEGFDTTTAMGRAMLGVAAVFAQLTREMIAENVRDGLQRRTEAGLFTGNMTKFYGFTHSREFGLAPVANEAAIVQQIFEWHADHKWRSTKAAHMLNLQGVPSKMGVQWAPKTVAAMIRNRVYCGEVHTKSGWIPGKHQAIVSKELFEAANSLIRTRKVQAPRTQASPHLLSGIVRCGGCGQSLYVHTTGNKSGTSPSSNLSYFHSRNVRVGEGACTGLYKRIELVDRLLVEQIALLAQSGAMQKVALSDVESRLQNERVPMIRERDKLLLEQEKIGERFTQWADRLDNGKIDEEQFDRQNLRLLEQKKGVQTRLATLECELGKGESLELSVDEVKSALRDFSSIWQELEFEERREMIRLLVEDLRLHKTHMELKLLFLDPVLVPWPKNMGRPKAIPQQVAVTQL